MLQEAAPAQLKYMHNMEWRASNIEADIQQ